MRVGSAGWHCCMKFHHVPQSTPRGPLCDLTAFWPPLLALRSRCLKHCHGANLCSKDGSLCSQCPMPNAQHVIACHPTLCAILSPTDCAVPQSRARKIAVAPKLKELAQTRHVPRHWMMKSCCGDKISPLLPRIRFSQGQGSGARSARAARGQNNKFQQVICRVSSAFG